MQPLQGAEALVSTAQKMKFFIKGFVTFTEEIFNRKLHFVQCSAVPIIWDCIPNETKLSV